MVLFNHATREMTAKIVYYGPGLCGKTTNLMVIFDKLDPKQKGKMLSLATKTDRTLFFDLLPVDIGKVGAFNLKIQLYTVPGQVFYNETRKLVLKGADSVVFVADSQPAMVEATRESFANLLENLEENNLDPNDIPIVIQYNKRDIPGVLPVDALQEALGFEGYPYTEAAAIKGEGVMETFKLVSRITAKHLMNRLKGGKEAAPKKVPTSPGVEKPAAKPAKVAEAPAPEPAPAFASSTPVAEEVPINPFADSMVTDSGYEAMEEVSLEQLLEGRERPATLSGAVPVPIEALEEIEELAPEEVVDEPSLAVAVAEEPSPIVHAGADDRVMALEAEVQQLRSRLSIMRDEQRTALEAILRELNDLTERVRAQLEA
ncbi:MAG TPA: GTPase domain-containing protein [Thermoanaerobaculia bacterium]|jgi:signal recognition particle receptor subunit beta|nr:GTPase domain-containing protein [Thermoanaerobaculia bacterium]